jgi:hypothetical protein
MAEAQRRCETKNQLFVSYSHSNKEIVHKIADELTKVKYKIWIDRNLIQGNMLFADIQNGIQTAHIVICFISENYCKSKNCMIEINFAYNKDKKILPIMLDDYFKVEQEGIQLMISRINNFYAFKQPDTFCPWNNNHFEKLKGTIFQLLSEICPTCSNKIQNEKQGLNSMNSFLNDENKPTAGKTIKSKDIFEGKSIIFNRIIKSIIFE